jgi:hypothetical protein
VAFIKATKHHHRASTHSDNINRSSQCWDLAWFLRSRCWGWHDFVWRLLLLHGGVTYKNEDKDMAEVMKYLNVGARLLS